MKRLAYFLLLLATACREVVDLAPRDADSIDASPNDAEGPWPDADPPDAGFAPDASPPDAAI